MAFLPQHIKGQTVPLNIVFLRYTTARWKTSRPSNEGTSKSIHDVEKLLTLRTGILQLRDFYFLAFTELQGTLIKLLPDDLKFFIYDRLYLNFV